MKHFNLIATKYFNKIISTFLKQKLSEFSFLRKWTFCSDSGLKEILKYWNFS